MFNQVNNYIKLHKEFFPIGQRQITDYNNPVTTS